MRRRKCEENAPKKFKSDGKLLTHSSMGGTKSPTQTEPVETKFGGGRRKMKMKINKLTNYLIKGEKRNVEVSEEDVNSQGSCLKFY